MFANEDLKALANSSYWDTYYTNPDGGETVSGHEWFRTYPALKPFFQRHLFDTHAASSHPRILHLGSGSSTIPSDLRAEGYDDQVCIDFSKVVVEHMARLHGADAGITWECQDVRDMKSIASESIDVAFDKATMDAMIHGSVWQPPAEVLDATSRYLHEAHRVLKSHGVLLYVTFRQPHFIRPLLERNDLWDLQVEKISSDDGGFGYFGWVLSKRCAPS